MADPGHSARNFSACRLFRDRIAKGCGTEDFREHAMGRGEIRVFRENFCKGLDRSASASSP